MVVVIIIEVYKQDKKWEEIIAKLNSKQESDKDNDVNQDRKEDISVHDDIGTK